MHSKAFMYLSGFLLVLLVVSVACSGGFALGRQVGTPTAAVVSRDAQVFASPEAPSSVKPTQQDQGGNPVENTKEPSTTIQAPEATQSPANEDELFKPFWQAWDIVHQQYVDQPVDDQALMEGAIRGMLESLGDKHTSYMDPDEFRQANIPLEQEYEGIGAWVDTNAEFLTIVSPMPNSPAEKAGLKPGDEVIAINGSDMTGIDGNLVIRQVLGPAGSKVTLTIRRSQGEGQDPKVFDVEITRAKITVPSVDSKMLDGNIAYVQLFQFADNTDQELRDALKPLLAQNPKGLILDLRNNGGGFLHTAVEVGSEFIDHGTILYEEYGNGTRDSYDATGKGIALDIPMVVLVNEGTASASEIVAGAIQDYNRAPLVGVTTYGKGSVQNWVPLDGNNGAVRVTIARWLTPKERQINEVGLEPDYKVELTEADIQAQKDVQLDKAIELLSNPGQ